MKSFDVLPENFNTKITQTEQAALKPLDIQCTARWWDRLIGLLSHDGLSSDQALWIKPCCMVHTFGMRFALSLHFLDKAGQIVHSEPRVLPNQIRWCFKAHSVVEMVAANPDEELAVQQQRLMHSLHGV